MKTAPSLERVTDILVEQLGLDAADIKPESRIQQDLGADSLDTVELTMAFEDEFDLDISDEDVARLERQGGGDVTVQQILTYLTEKVPA